MIVVLTDKLSYLEKLAASTDISEIVFPKNFSEMQNLSYQMDSKSDGFTRTVRGLMRLDSAKLHLNLRRFARAELIERNLKLNSDINN